MPVTVKKVTIYKCSACDHEWQSRGGAKPLRCARCKSPYWDRKKGGRR
jgi:DNA-directed RNA polymerase subunit RPC12/RpoP